MGRLKEGIIAGDLTRSGFRKVAGTAMQKSKSFKNFAKKVLEFLKQVDYVISYYPKKRFRDKTKVVPNRIVIMTNTFNYTCNPKYIYKELCKREGLDIYWIVKDLEEARSQYPKDAQLVAFGTMKCMEIVYSAKVWLDNGIAFSNYYDKKPEQIHIQTMHGSLGIKRLDNAVLSRNARGKSGQRVVQREENNTNLVLTNSQFEEDVFKSVFWHSTPMERLGHARTDILFAKEDGQVVAGIRKRLLAMYGIPTDAKIVLYAPTHRAGLTADDLDIDCPLLCEELSKKFGGTYVVLFRLHDRSFKLLKDVIDQDGMYDVSRYPDIQELMLVTDVGITDYSSWIFDYVNTRRPGFIYAADIDRYNSRTGFYYLLEETPFPVCEDNDDLIAAVRGFDMAAYKQKVEEFLQEKEAVDDGHAAERIADRMLEMMQL